MAESSTSFKKNNNANPVGRPKGSVSPITKAFKEILNAQVPEDIQDMYDNVINSAKDGEAWANELFWRKFVPDMKHTDKISLGIKAGDDIDTIIRKIVESLSMYSEYTLDDLFKCLSILTRIKFSDKLEDDGVDVLEICNNDELFKIQKIINEAKNRNKS